MNADAPYECVTSKVLPAARIVASAALRAALATSRVLWGAGPRGAEAGPGRVESQASLWAEALELASCPVAQWGIGEQAITERADPGPAMVMRDTGNRHTSTIAASSGERQWPCAARGRGIEEGGEGGAGCMVLAYYCALRTTASAADRATLATLVVSAAALTAASATTRAPLAASREYFAAVTVAWATSTRLQRLFASAYTRGQMQWRISCGWLHFKTITSSVRAKGHRASSEYALHKCNGRC